MKSTLCTGEDLGSQDSQTSGILQECPLRPREMLSDSQLPLSFPVTLRLTWHRVKDCGLATCMQRTARMGCRPSREPDFLTLPPSTGLGSRVVQTVSVIEFHLIYSAFDLKKKKILLLKMITEAWMSQLTPLGNYISLPLLRYLFLW